MSENVCITLIDKLRASGIPFDDGLSDSEINQVEETFSFRFPPDLRLFLQTGLPTGDRFPNWRKQSSEQLLKWLSDPAEGICFDIEHNGFWFTDWGERPSNLGEAKQVAREMISGAPTLIPVYGHRFIPSLPAETGNPVFSIVQTDIIIYGLNLWNYIAVDLLSSNEYPATSEPKYIEFWSKLVDLNNEDSDL